MTVASFNSAGYFRHNWISAQVYINIITAKPITIAKIFKAISHGGNTSQPFLIISFNGLPYIIINPR